MVCVDGTLRLRDWCHSHTWPRQKVRRSRPAEKDKLQKYTRSQEHQITHTHDDPGVIQITQDHSKPK